MPHVLGDRSDPRTETNQQRTTYPRAVIAYAILCIVAAVFIIGSAVFSG